MRGARFGSFAAAAALVAAVLPAHADVGATDVAGVPASHVGEHGPVSDYLHGPLELVGHTDLRPAGSTTALGNNGGVALIGHCAYVGRWHDYDDRVAGSTGDTQYPVQIVDVADPAAPHVVGSVPGSDVPHAVAREIRAVDLPGFRMLTVQTFGKYLNEGITRAGQHALYFYTFPEENACDEPVLAGRIDLRPFRPHEFFQWIDPNPEHDVDGHPRILEYVTTPVSGLDGVVVDASHPDKPALLGVWHGLEPPASATEANLSAGVPAGAGRYTHSISISPDGTRAFVSQWDGGYLTFDTSDYANAAPAPVFKPLASQSVPFLYASGPGNTHSAVPLQGTNDVIVGDEIYVTTNGCPFGAMRIVDVGNATQPPHQVAAFGLAENDPANCDGKLSASRNSLGRHLDGTFTMHNQTVTEHYVLTSWYGGGLRVVDVSDPEAPVEVAFFVPRPVDATISVPDTSAPVYGGTEDDSADDWLVSTWSYPIVRDGLIYVSDIRSGLYILRATPGSPLATELAAHHFLEGNSNLGDVLG